MSSPRLPLVRTDNLRTKQETAPHQCRNSQNMKSCLRLNTVLKDLWEENLRQFIDRLNDDESTVDMVVKTRTSTGTYIANIHSPNFLWRTKVPFSLAVFHSSVTICIHMLAQ